MPAAIVKKNKDIAVTVVKKMRDYSQDPFFLKKAEKARAILKKHNLPIIKKK